MDIQGGEYGPRAMVIWVNRNLIRNSTRLFQKEGCAITTIIPAGSLTQSELSLLLSAPSKKKKKKI